MNLKTRRVVALGFCLFFLIISPLIILYSLGFKYNWQKKHWEKTGVFFIKSFPKDAEIYLDELPNKKTTPTQITRLLPKNYAVKISKKQYRPWLKNLTIQSEKTTFIEDVSLIYENFNWQMIKDGSFTGLLASPNKQLLAVTEKNQNTETIWLYQLAGNKISQLYQTKSSPVNLLAWSFSGQRLLIKQAGEYLILNLENPNSSLNLKQLAKHNLSEVRWHNANDNILYGLNGETLWQVNLLNKSAEPIVKDKLLSYAPFKNHLIGISKDKDKLYLKLYENNKTKTLFSLPNSKKYLFQEEANGQLILIDQEQRQLFLIKPEDETQPVVNVLKNVDGFEWHDQQLLYWNNSELWIFYPQSNEKILLERSSQPITYGFWHPNAAYVYGQVGNQLKLYELDSRGERNIYNLFNLAPSQVKPIATNKKGDYLYLIASPDNYPGFYRINIQ